MRDTDGLTYSLRNFRQVDRDLRGCDSNADTVQDSPCNERPEAIRRDLDGSAREPPQTSKEDTAELKSATNERALVRCIRYLSRRPHLSEIGPAIKLPITEPAASEEPIAPWTMPWGLSKYSIY
jgi:hypothetical protein